MDLKKFVAGLTGTVMPSGVHVAWVARSFGRRELAPLRPEDIAALAQVLQAVDAPTGTKLLSTGDKAEAAYIVEAGEVELFARQGETRSLVSIQRAGGVFGDVPMLCAMPFPFDAVVRQDARLLVVGHDELLEVLATHPAIGLRWLSSAVRRLEYANRRLAAMTTGGVAERVTVLLADEATAVDTDRDEVAIDLTQAEMAALLGTTRQSVNRALKELADGDLVTTQYGKVVVTDPAGLRERSGRTFAFPPSC